MTQTPSSDAASTGRSADTSDRPQVAASPRWAADVWDVVVIGGGNAGLSSAMAAADLGASVLLLECAPRHLRGGNSRHTRNIRYMHEESSAFNTGRYSFDELWGDLCGVGDGPNDVDLAQFTVRESESAPDWMHAHGARWQQPLAGTLHLSRTNRFFLGGGKALLNSYYRHIERQSRVTVAYDARVDDLEVAGNRCAAVGVTVQGVRFRVQAKTVVCASGGYEANLDWLRRFWGDAVDNYVIRGTPHNDGQVLSLLYAAGAATAGEEQGFHAVAVDARAPKFDGGIATRLDAIPFGIVVNKHGQRFYDEGEEIWPKRYAIWGRKIANQPDQTAIALWDSKVNELFLPPMYPAAKSDDLGELAAALGLDSTAVFKTVDAFNAAVVAGKFDPAVLDSCHTAGLATEKSHWAQRLDRPPYFGIIMRPGITFTYMGVAVDSSARVRRVDGSVFGNVFAAGEIMSGNILSTGYLAGFGMTIGTVWGRQAGAEAARHAGF